MNETEGSRQSSKLGLSKLWTDKFSIRLPCRTVLIGGMRDDGVGVQRSNECDLPHLIAAGTICHQ